MQIRTAKTDREKNELDQLLWDVLWKPLGLPRDIRKSFSLNGRQIEIIVINGGIVIGGLVANWLSSRKIEIRHIAVSPEHQGTSIGRRLVEKLITQVRRPHPVKILTDARNTSVGFFTKLGFKLTGITLEHPNFMAHGISIHEMCLELNSSTNE